MAWGSKQKPEPSPKRSVWTPPEPNQCGVSFSVSCRSVTSAMVSVESLLRQLQQHQHRMFKHITWDEQKQRLIIQLEPEGADGHGSQNGV